MRRKKEEEREEGREGGREGGRIVILYQRETKEQLNDGQPTVRQDGSKKKKKGQEKLMRSH
jgi:hypothetical protein